MEKLHYYQYFSYNYISFFIVNRGEDYSKEVEKNKNFDEIQYLDGGNQDEKIKIKTKTISKGDLTENKQLKNIKIYIDVKGAVEHPNVYKMSSVDRVIDAVNEAKPTKEADLSQINLSERLIDQKIIYIPRKGETIASSPQSSNKTS